MSRTKHEAAAELAEQMLRVLESRRTFGGDSDPPTLRELGEHADPTAPPERIVQATGKKAVTEGRRG